jgi:hypothetical protein
MENGVKGVQQHAGMKQAERLFCFNNPLGFMHAGSFHFLDA